MKKINGFTYSVKPFKGWMFVIRFDLMTLDFDVFLETLDIYTDCTNLGEINKSISSVFKDKVEFVNLNTRKTHFAKINYIKKYLKQEDGKENKSN